MKLRSIFLPLLLAATSACAQEFGASLPNIQRVFIQTSESTVTNTIAESSLFGAGIGERNFRPAAWDPGRSYEIKLRGVIWTPASAPSIQLNLKLGSAVLASRLSNLPANLANDPWEMDLLLTCQTNGASGLVQSQGSLKLYPGSGGVNVLTFKGPAVAVNLSGQNQLDITATNSVGAVSVNTRSAIITLMP